MTRRSHAVLAAAIALASVAQTRPVRAADAPSAHDAASDTLRRVVTMPVVEVNTSRADGRSAISSTTLDRADVLRLNWGQDTPMALATLPGAYAYSDAGNGIGYSYLAIRGFPQRRISVLVNGVPLNDPESHEVWWIDHPDLLASTAQVQVQRGVGPALYGAAALGGSVDVATSALESQPRFSVSSEAGSFGTRRLSIEGVRPAGDGGWQVGGRYSRIETDGYRDQSWSKLWSYALTARRSTPTQQWTADLFGGPENTHLAYLGTPPDYLAGTVTGNADRDRRYNPITYPGEQDHFFEPHYELVHTWLPTPRVALTQTLFYFDGTGYYDERRTGQSIGDYRLHPWNTSDPTLYPESYYITDAQGHPQANSQGLYTVILADLVRRREVTNRHFGWIPRVRVQHPGGTLTLGGELRWHDGHHVGTVISGDGLPPGTAPDAPYYDYHPRTFAAGLFAREEWDLRQETVRITADLAWRHQGYQMRGDRFDGIAFDQAYDFALPRLSAQWQATSRLSVYGSWAYASREPAFRDLYDAEGVGSLPLYRVVDVAAGVYRDPLITPEHVSQLELGGRWQGHDSSLRAAVYRMDFRDELVYAGQFNTDLGYPILGNAAQSVHQGLELEGRAGRDLGALHAELDGNVSRADNHFVRYTEHYGPTAADDVSYDGKPIGFFPATMWNLAARLRRGGLSASLEAQYAGRIYVDNTGTDAASIAPRTVANVTLAASRAVGGTNVEASLRVFNVTDVRYATGGYMDVDPNDATRTRYVPWLTPAATRNFLAGLRLSW